MAPENTNELYKKPSVATGTRFWREFATSVNRWTALANWIWHLNPQFAITDQNHVGGIGFVVELAKAAGIHSAIRVVDQTVGPACKP